MKSFVAVAIAQVALAIAILVTISAQAASLAPSASEIDRKASAALSQLYSQNEGARALGAKAKGVLVFPDIRRAAFILGAR
jgi:lipid-binding SYLF domain-containing protein